MEILLEEICPNDMDLGDLYTSINENIFVSQQMVDQKQKIYRKNFGKYLTETF